MAIPYTGLFKFIAASCDSRPGGLVCQCVDCLFFKSISDGAWFNRLRLVKTPNCNLPQNQSTVFFEKWMFQRPTGRNTPGGSLPIEVE
jgi:hypothetical protein